MEKTQKSAGNKRIQRAHGSIARERGPCVPEVRKGEDAGSWKGTGRTGAAGLVSLGMGAIGCCELAGVEKSKKICDFEGETHGA